MMKTRRNDAHVNCESLNVKNMYIMSITPISDINCSDLVPQAVQLNFRLVIHAGIHHPGVIRLLISVTALKLRVNDQAEDIWSAQELGSTQFEIFRNMLQLLGNDARKSPAVTSQCNNVALHS